MFRLDQATIQDKVADNRIIFQRGRKIYEYGSYICQSADPDQGRFVYAVDGTYGDYTTVISLNNSNLDYTCDCPYPGDGCKHVVAVMLDLLDQIQAWEDSSIHKKTSPAEDYLSPEEIRDKALADRRSRAKKEHFKFIPGEMVKGDHLLENQNGRQYLVTVHDPISGSTYVSTFVAICRRPFPDKS